MKGVLLFFHVLGFAAWLGGGLSAMLAGITAKSFAPAERLAVYRAVGAIGRNLIGTGAILVVVTGILLAVPYMQGGGNAAWLSGMMGFGILAALVGAFIVAPTAARLARLQVDARGELPEAFAALRKRQVIFGTVSGVLALLALLSVTVLR